MPSISDTLYIASQIENALTASSCQKVTASEKHGGIHRNQPNFRHFGKKLPPQKSNDLTTDEALEKPENLLGHIDLRV